MSISNYHKEFTNVQIGKVDHMYNYTLYGSKSTQADDTKSISMSVMHYQED